jgi:hypothetical protein
MSFNYERRHQPLASPIQFRRRVLHHGALALWAVVASLVVGTLGYHLLGRQAWIDSFLNACMLLGGMGPVGDLTTNAGKVFAALFALYSGLLFIALSGLLLAPFLHRLMHVFHIDQKS